MSQTKQLIQELNEKINSLFWMLVLILALLIIMTVAILKCIDERHSEEMKALNGLSNTCGNNFSSLLTLSTMREYCKEKEPKGYKLDYWWNGCSSREEKVGFTCGYVNKDGATLFKCYKWEDVLG